MKLFARDLDLDNNEELDSPLTIDGDVEENIKKIAKTVQQSEGDFYENLAEKIEDTGSGGHQYLDRLGTQIIDQMRKDISARETWENQIKIGLQLLGTGFINMAGEASIPGLSKPFDNSPSNAFSGALLEVLVALQATCEKELLPAAKLVKVASNAEDNEEVNERNQRVEKFTNDLLIRQSSEFYPTVSQTMLWAFVAGESFIKVAWDKFRNRPTFQRITPFDLILPPTHSDVRSSPRVLHRYMMSERELRLKQESGFYRDVDLNAYDGDDDFESNDIERDVDGVDTESDLPDRLNPVYKIVEAHIDLHIDMSLDRFKPENKRAVPLPYIVHIEESSKKILGIYRNWDEQDQMCEKLNWFASLTFFPGFYGRGYGLAHLGGENATAATRVIRDIFNLNTLNINPAGYRLKGMRVDNHNKKVNPGDWISLDSPATSIRETLQQLQFPLPSPMMLEVKSQFENSIHKIGGALMNTPDAIPTQVGQISILALMEKASESQTAVVQRFHRGLKDLFQILFTLLQRYFPAEGVAVGLEEEDRVTAEDFAEDITLMPVSDPNLSSRVQRLMSDEAILNLADKHPDLHNFEAIYKRIYTDLGVADLETILETPEEATPLDPLSENMNMLQGKPAKASIEQDHQAHITVHSLLLQDPSVGEDVKALAQAHVQEHMALAMAVQLQQATGLDLPPEEEREDMPMELQNQIAVQLAQASQQMLEQMAQEQQPQRDPLLEELELRRLSQQERTEIEQLKVQLKLIEALTRDQRDKYEAALKFYKETGVLAPSYEEMTGERELTTADALDLASEVNAEADQRLAQINQDDQQMEQQLAQAGQHPEEGGPQDPEGQPPQEGEAPAEAPPEEAPHQVQPQEDSNDQIPQ